MEKYIEPIIHDLFIAIRMHIPRSNGNFDLKKPKPSRQRIEARKLLGALVSLYG